ncbi:hypothetical protein CsatA_018127 [Cannabis sativa]
MQGVKTQSSPMNSGLRLSYYGSDPVEDATTYMSIVGALRYATITRPDIGFSVNKVCQFIHQPLQSHLVAVKRISRYLVGTLDYGLHLKCPSSLQLEAFCDADWVAYPDDCRSITGFYISLGENLVGWQSKKQATISRSSTEAEYCSIPAVVTAISWINSLLFELHQTPPATLLVWCDNLLLFISQLILFCMLAPNTLK